MKIYFENGELQPDELDVAVDYICDARYGYSQNLNLLRELYAQTPKCVIYTNSLAALSSSFAWNDEFGIPDIYMREDINCRFKNIVELHGGDIRISQNIEAMYKSGCFGCV